MMVMRIFNWGVQQENQMYSLMDQLSSQGIRYAFRISVLEHKGKSNDLLKNMLKTQCNSQLFKLQL